MTRRSLGWVLTGLRRGLVALVAVAMIAVLVDFFAGPFVFPATKSSPVELHDGALIGTIEGAIKGTDPDARIVRLPHGLLGLASRTLVVTEQTKIAIGAKLGGFDDLAPGQVVRVTYAVSPDPDRLVAQRIDILNGLAPEPPRPTTVETEQAHQQPAASPAGLSNGPAAKVKPVPVPRANAEQPKGPSRASSPALNEARRLERLPVPRAATVVQPAPEVRREEPVTPAPPPPAPRVSRPPDVVTVSPPAPIPPAPRVQPAPDGQEIFKGSREAP